MPKWWCENVRFHLSKLLAWFFVPFILKGLLIALGLIFLLFYLQSPAKTRALIDAYDFWPTVVICATLVIVAIRAFLKSR